MQKPQTDRFAAKKGSDKGVWSKTSLQNTKYQGNSGDDNVGEALPGRKNNFQGRTNTSSIIGSYGTGWGQPNPL